MMGQRLWMCALVSIAVTVSVAPGQSVPADGTTIIQDGFVGKAGAGLIDRFPDGAHLAGDGWKTVAFNGAFAAVLAGDAGTASFAHLWCAGNSNGAIVFSLANRDGFTKPRRLGLSADLRGACPALGYYSTFPEADKYGGIDVFAHFSGLGITDDGTLVLYQGGCEASRVKYGGAFDRAAFHTLRFDVDTESGAIADVSFSGSTGDYSPLKATTAFTDAATQFVGAAALCESGNDNVVDVAHFQLGSRSSLAAMPRAAAAPIADDSPLLIKTGDRIGFLGDSITAQGAGPNGYITLTMAGLKLTGVDATAIPAGHSGDTSGNMLGRINPQVLHQGVNWMTLSCGGNDIVLQPRGFGVDLEGYKRNVETMYRRCAAWNVKLLIVTSTPIGPDLNSANNRQLQGYLDFLHQFASEQHLPLADVNAAFVAALKGNPDKPLFFDATHPNADGQFLMATTLLQAMGVPASEMPRITAALPKGAAH